MDGRLRVINPKFNFVKKKKAHTHLIDLAISIYLTNSHEQPSRGNSNKDKSVKVTEQIYQQFQCIKHSTTNA